MGSEMGSAGTEKRVWRRIECLERERTTTEPPMANRRPMKLRIEKGSRSTVAAMTALATTATAPSGETTVGLASPNAVKFPISPTMRPHIAHQKRGWRVALRPSSASVSEAALSGSASREMLPAPEASLQPLLVRVLASELLPRHLLLPLDLSAAHFPLEHSGSAFVCFASASSASTAMCTHFCSPREAAISRFEMIASNMPHSFILIPAWSSPI